MTISQLMGELACLINEEGDIEVRTNEFGGTKRSPTIRVEISYGPFGNEPKHVYICGSEDEQPTKKRRKK